MLRQKLLARLGLLVVGFVAGAVVSIVLLQNVLQNLDAMKADSEAIIVGVQELGRAFAAVEKETGAVAQGISGDPSTLRTRIDELNAVVQKLGNHEVMRGPDGAGAAEFARVREGLSGYLSDAGRPSSSGLPGPEVFAQATALRGGIAELSAIACRHVEGEQADLSRRLRTLIVGLTIAALVITNIAIFVLLTTANMILRPVKELIEGSRELAAEHFGHRIKIDQHDEFDELARAYNALADQLAANEQRKVTALQQLAVTLNHELNNIINIIEFQLRLLNRKTGGSPELAVQLGEIHGNLERMAGIIASLRSVRRVVVNDYIPGETMLDLPKCIEPDDGPGLIEPKQPGVKAP